MTRVKIIALVCVIALAATGALLWAGISVMDRAGGMVPTGTSARQFASAPVGTQVKLIVLVERANANGEVGAQILNKAGNDSYVRSGSRIVLKIPADTDYLMGGERDVKAGAVLQINGHLSSPAHLTVHNVVILTVFVRLEA